MKPLLLNSKKLKTDTRVATADHENNKSDLQIRAIHAQGHCWNQKLFPASLELFERVSMLLKSFDMNTLRNNSLTLHIVLLDLKKTVVIPSKTHQQLESSKYILLDPIYRSIPET